MPLKWLEIYIFTKTMITGFGIHVKVKNFYKSYAFYKDFGFKECFAYGEKEFLKTLPKNVPTAPEKYRGVVFNTKGALLEIADGHIAVKSNVFKQDLLSSKVSAMIHVDSLTNIIKVCKKKGYKIVVEPKEYPWGTRELVIKDPDGFVLVFIEKL